MFLEEDATFSESIRGLMIFGVVILCIFVGCHFVMTPLLLIGNEKVSFDAALFFFSSPLSPRLYWRWN